MKNIAVIDLGGTNIKSGRINYGEKTLCHSFSLPTNAHLGFGAILHSLDASILENVDKDTVGIAISSAGDIDAVKGVCVYATDNLPNFSGFKIKEYVENKFNLKCSVINDGQAALLGEIFYGAEVGLTKVIMLTLGTGVGGAMYDGKIIFGDDYRFGRFGHVVLYENGLPCNCGEIGCAEQYISGTALLNKAQTLNPNIKSGKQLFDFYKANDKTAISVVQSFITDMVNTINVLSEKYVVSDFILGGGIMGAKGIILPLLRKRLPDKKIVAATLNNTAGLFGAYKWFNCVGEIKE